MNPLLIVVIIGLIAAFVLAVRYLIRKGFACSSCGEKNCSTCNALMDYQKKMEEKKSCCGSNEKA